MAETDRGETMKKEVRTICHDQELGLEAYRFEGIVQPFPNHFHSYYVIGFVEAGERQMSCRGREYTLLPGSIVLFHPGDNHACVQSDGGTFDYRGFNLPCQVMLDLAEEVTLKRELPGFSRNVIRDGELLCSLKALHELVMAGSGEFEKEELLLWSFARLMERYGQPFARSIPECREEVERACAFLREHYARRISLEEIGRWVGVSKSTLLRAFVRAKGVTPYRYLETVRVEEAKKLLEQGAAPAEAALGAGFSDQSHFTNFFRRFIGLTPGAYGEMVRRRGGRRDGEGERHGET